MPGRLLAAARTPWAPRHTALEGVRPEVLLGAALSGAVERARIRPAQIDRVLVACDTSVGAQDLDIARRVALSLGWTEVPGLTVDGQGVGGLALVDLAVSLPGLTIVAGVDASSMIPPGAGLVRDYGRPTMDEPEHRWLERLAHERGLDRAALDAVVRDAVTAVAPAASAVLPDGISGVQGDVRRTIDLDEPAPLTDDGLLTADHLAPWADGAVAVVIGDDPRGRTITATSTRAGTDEAAIDWLSADDRAIPADHSAVVAALAAPRNEAVASPLAIGSTPSCDGLRVLADAAVAVTEVTEVRTRGRHGQMAAVTLGAP